MSSKKTPRKNGAPYGNRNALKHGFYSRQFRNLKLKDIEESDTINLEEEIKMMRLLFRSAFERINEINDLEGLLRLLRAISPATDSLTRLVKTQYWLGSNKNETADAIKNALAEIAEELGLDDDAPSAPPPQESES